MKRIIVIAAILLFSIPALAQNGRSIYKKYSEADDVSAVYISPAMFRLIGKIPSVEVDGGDVDFTSIVKSLTGFYLIDSENKTINSKIRDDVDRFVKSGNYEMLMEVKDKDETVHFYTVGKGDTITSFVMLAYEADNCTFICMDGDMQKDKLEDIIARANK